jgi:Ribbon-helix-helix protein, copG family
MYLWGFGISVCVRFVLDVPDPRDPPPPRVRRRGKRWGPSKKFVLVLPEYECRALDDLARMQGVTRNAVVRRAIDMFVAYEAMRLQREARERPNRNEPPDPG